jgi:para-nitrobenzyl esterase
MAAILPKAGFSSVDQPEVRAACGTLAGTWAGGVRRFAGIPFAQPPVGKLRFRHPLPLPRWRGTRDATLFAAAAMQPNQPKIPQSEDCLYLNVWTPAVVREPLPVLVWIHGGGLVGGRSFDPLFDGARFAREGVLCVTIAYRLGAFGFLDVEPMLGPSYGGSANNGLRDIMAALAWVRENIFAFGGDPDKITVGGESAGAKLTDILMGIEPARPLFGQMISESGGAERVFSKFRALDVCREFAGLWQDAGNRPEELTTAPPSTILDAQDRLMEQSSVHFPLRPEIDGDLLKTLPVDTISAGSCRGKRLLLGTNLDESALFLGPHPDKDPRAHDLGTMSLDAFRAREEQYRALRPPLDESMLRIRSVTAEEYWIPSLRVAEAIVSGGGQAFVYRFDFPSPGGRYKGLAYHSFELPFVWDHFDAGREQTTEELQLAATMHAAWVSFIRSGTPSAAGLPQWPAYTETLRQTMVFNTTSRVERDPRAREYAIWNGFLD